MTPMFSILPFKSLRAKVALSILLLVAGTVAAAYAITLRVMNGNVREEIVKRAESLNAEEIIPRKDYLRAQADRDRGYMQWQTGPANRAAAIRIMQPWAEALRKGLDRARATPQQDKE